MTVKPVANEMPCRFLYADGLASRFSAPTEGQPGSQRIGRMASFWVMPSGVVFDHMVLVPAGNHYLGIETADTVPQALDRMAELAAYSSFAELCDCMPPAFNQFKLMDHGDPLPKLSREELPVFLERTRFDYSTVGMHAPADLAAVVRETWQKVTAEQQAGIAADAGRLAKQFQDLGLHGLAAENQARADKKD